MAESRAARQARAKKILELLDRAYPDAKIALNFRTPFELLVATILSAQCTDERVNMVTPALFRKYPTARALAWARPASLEKDIRSTGFFRAKTRSLRGLSEALVQRPGTVCARPCPDARGARLVRSARGARGRTRPGRRPTRERIDERIGVEDAGVSRSA